MTDDDKKKIHDAMLNAPVTVRRWNSFWDCDVTTDYSAVFGAFMEAEMDFNDEFLDTRENAIVNEELAGVETEAYIRFWSSTSVQIDGDCSVECLEAIVRAMKRMQAL